MLLFAFIGCLSLLQLLLCILIVTRALVRVRRHDCLACIHCGYLLEGLGEEGVCPECGNEYDIESTRHLWLDACSQSLTLRMYEAFARFMGRSSPTSDNDRPARINGPAMIAPLQTRTPPILRRGIWMDWLVFLMLLGAFMFLLFTILPQHILHVISRGGSRHMIILELAVILFSPLPIGLVANYFFVTRLLVRVERHKHELCFYCGYPLTGLDDADKCPECGQTYDIDTTRQIWERMCSRSPMLRIRRACKALFRFRSSD
jgi:predicted RNA-binding Zn-ribbon protein involved in translation (DUF1610 family)